MLSTLATTTFFALCVAALSTPRGTSDCGVVGYDKANPKANFFRNNDPKAATFEGCLALCKEQSRCASFAIGNGECLLYPTDIDKNVRVDSRSPFTFFSVHCKPAAPAPAPAPAPTPVSPATPVTSPKSPAAPGVTGVDDVQSVKPAQSPVEQAASTAPAAVAASSALPTPSVSPNTPGSPAPAAPTSPNGASSVVAAPSLALASLLFLFHLFA